MLVGLCICMYMFTPKACQRELYKHIDERMEAIARDMSEQEEPTKSIQYSEGREKEVTKKRRAIGRG